MFARTANVCYPAPMNRHDSPDMVRLHNPDPGAGPERRRPWWIVPIASGLIIAVIIAAIIFAVTRTSISGNWYGPGNFEGANSTVAAATYFQLSQQITGSISGSGQMCIRSAQGIIQAPVTIEGNISGSTVKLTVHLNSSSLPLANTLEMQGALADGTITLSGTAPPGLLTIQQGSQVDYTNACTNLPVTT